MGKGYFLTGGLAGPWKKSKIEKILLDVVPLELTAEVSEVSEKEVYTFDLTAQEAYEAFSNGRTMKCVVDLGAGATSEFITSLTVEKNTTTETSKYAFRFVAADGKAFSVENLSGSDTLVLTEE